MDKFGKLVYDYIEKQTINRIERMELEMEQAKVIIKLGKLQLGDDATKEEISLLVSKQLDESVEYCEALITAYEYKHKSNLN